MQGPPIGYKKDVETAECTQGVVGYETRRDRENEHGVEASANSYSYDRSESDVRVDGGSDGPTDENVPDGNDGTNGWNVHGGGACRRTGNRLALHY